MSFCKNNPFGQPTSDIQIIKDILEGKTPEPKKDAPPENPEVWVNPEITPDGTQVLPSEDTETAPRNDK